MISPGAALARWGQSLIDLLYPPVCPLCYRVLTPGDTTVCYECRSVLQPHYDWQCNYCGAWGTGAAPERGDHCRLCPPTGAAWQGVFSVTGYSQQAGRCVHLFKYRGRFELGDLMAGLMVQRLTAPLSEFGGRLAGVAPVPLHWRRRIARGFNQSDRLARTLAQALDLPYAPKLLRRVKHTRRQALIPKDRRADNVKGAFRLGKGFEIRDQGVLLIDDVVTSGHTIEECARVLRDGGAREVWVASFARSGMWGGGGENE